MNLNQNWKKQLEPILQNYQKTNTEWSYRQITDFISTEIIGKLIDEMPNELGIHGNNCPHCRGDNCECECQVCQPPQHTLKQQLRAKWL